MFLLVRLNRAHQKRRRIGQQCRIVMLRDVRNLAPHACGADELFVLDVSRACAQVPYPCRLNRRAQGVRALTAQLRTKCAVLPSQVLIRWTMQVLKKTEFASGTFEPHELDKKWDGYDKDRVVCS